MTILPRSIIRLVLPAVASLGLVACTTYQDIGPNTSLEQVTQIMGSPTLTCNLPNGAKRLIWSKQPYAQYSYASDISPNGQTDKVTQVLSDDNFKKLSQGTWTSQQILCEFGPPAQKERIGLGEKKEWVWSYRYKQSNYWNALMHVYLGLNGDQLSHYHPGPDPAYDDDGRLKLLDF